MLRYFILFIKHLFGSSVLAVTYKWELTQHQLNTILGLIEDPYMLSIGVFYAFLILKKVKLLTFIEKSDKVLSYVLHCIFITIAASMEILEHNNEHSYFNSLFTVFKQVLVPFFVFEFIHKFKFPSKE